MVEKVWEMKQVYNPTWKGVHFSGTSSQDGGLGR